MQSENFDKKIRDSLSQRPPENDNPQWDKMEPLLDKHMPVEKKDRRRIFFILFLFLLLGGGAFFIWKNNGRGENDITASKPNTENSIPANKPNQTDNSKIEKTATELPNNNSSAISSAQKTDQPSIQPQSNTDKLNNKIVLSRTENRDDKPIVKTKIDQRLNRNNTRTTRPTKRANDNTQAIIAVDNNVKQETIPTVEEKQKIDEPQKPTEVQKQDEQITKEEVDKKDDQKSVENKTDEQQQKLPESQPILTANSKTQKQKSKSSLFSNLFFTASIGPDFSAVGINKTGRIEPVIGAGIGYQFSKRFSVRTGFYTARKVYSADPEDYHPPANFWAYYPNLKNIEANCKVYEIPVTIDYTFSQNKKQSWFVSTGLSSLLMKEETYDYYYKPNSSPTYVSYKRTIKDENKHYFSVLNLSGGYTRNINKNLSLRAEPYAKFALGGVGYGKVKLNSGGVLFSAIIKPFARK